MRKAVARLDTVFTSVPPPPRLLIAENNLALLELLPASLSQHIPGVVMDICSSLDAAIVKLPRSSYDMVVANVGLSEIGNFSLLKQHRKLHPSMPFIVTAGAQDHEIARHAIARGAFDIIVAPPLTPSEAVSTVQLAYKFHELKMTIALRQRKLDHLRDQHGHHERGIYILPTFTNKMTTTSEGKYDSRQNTLRAYEQTINALQRSLTLLINQSTQLEREAVQGTMKRLDVLLTMARQGGQV